MSSRERSVSALGLWSAWASGLALVVTISCGSEDSARSLRKEPENGGANAAGEHAAGAAGENAAPAGGLGGSANAGAGGSAELPPGGAGSGSGAGAAGAATDDCASVEPVQLQGLWTSSCNGYTCQMYVAASGAFANGCSNGQYESGMVSTEGSLETLGEGGAIAPYSTKGSLTRNDCDSVTRDYIAQIPPNTGTEQQYSCEMTRLPSCGPTLLAALSGAWLGTCGSTQTCTTTFTETGEMSSICSNGQTSVGSIDETGVFSDAGGGGASANYSTRGVVALNADCNSFFMPYTWQSPPNQGAKNSASCSYVREQDE